MIRRFLLHLVANAAALYFVSLMLDGDFAITGGIQGYFVTAFIFGFINALVKPILKIIALPLILMTFGLFTLVLNIVVLFLARYALNVLQFQGIGIEFKHIAAFFYASLLLGVANLLISWLTDK